MATGYCVKCKKKVEIKDAAKTKTKKGKDMMKGKCPDCGTTVCTFKIENIFKFNFYFLVKFGFKKSYLKLAGTETLYLASIPSCFLFSSNLSLKIL